LVHHVTFASFENFSVTKKDSNTGISLGYHDEVAHITYSGYKPRGTTNPLTVSKHRPIITEFQEIKGD